MDIISREEWGAAEFRGTPTPMDVDTIILHHSAGAGDDGTREGAIKRVKEVQRYHQATNGWADVGYHYLISQGGYVLQGRPQVNGKPVVGSHCPPNTGKIGVCLLGCFHPPAGDWCTDKLEGKQQGALVDLLRELMNDHGLETDRIRLHRDYRATACPGEHVAEALGHLRLEAGQEDELPVAHHLDEIERHLAAIRRIRKDAQRQTPS